MESQNSKEFPTKATYNTISDKKNQNKKKNNNNDSVLNKQISQTKSISNKEIIPNNNNNISEITTNPNITHEKSLFSSQSERIYIGKYIGGQKNGQGKLLLPNDSEYEGNFKNNEFDGYGVFKSKSYNYYGNFNKGKMKGKGKYEDLIKGSIYDGEFFDDQKNGYGEEKYSDGSVYKGEFKNGLKDGKGILILKNNNNESFIYNGEFKKGQICGKGRFKWNNKKEYFGEWENNEMSGYGNLLDGKTRYIGYFLHNMKEGFGAIFYEEQSMVLIGKWKENLTKGPSILYPLNKNNNKITLENEQIIGMYKGEIINMSLGEEDINTFKTNDDYQEMIDLYKNTFYPDFLKCTNNNNGE